MIKIEQINRSLGGVVDAYFLEVRCDDVSGASLDAARSAIQDHAKDRVNLLGVTVRRTDHPGHPHVCAWQRETVNDLWAFEWQEGAEDRLASPLTL